MADTIKFTINGQEVELTVDAKDLLVDIIRYKLGLTGTKKGCGSGDCGACTVLLNGKPVRSCLTLAFMVDGKNIETIEGVGSEENVHPIQKAFVEEGAIQCGFCTPGMIVTTKALIDGKEEPTDEEIKEALSGNLCRCTGYTKILKAVKKSALLMREEKS